MTEHCVGIVLAGGQSSRMGTDKAQLKRGEQTMLEFSRDMLVKAGIDDIYISTNEAQAQGIKDVIANCGPLGGIYSVISAITADAALITAVDMPLLSSTDLTRLLKHGRQRQRPVCYQDNYLPLYLPLNRAVTAYLKQQLFNDGNRKVKALISAFDGHFIPHPDPLALNNANTPQQWQQSLAHISSGE